ncbi:TPA: hypothetical protein MYN03_001584 [Klebsiella pneumoniae]|nr:hypothetical protein [Klebsiella pneumoniae]
MTDITELAQSLKAAAVRVIKNYDSEWFEAGHQICTVHKSKINLISLANPINVLALVEALETEKRICATWRKTAEANSENLEKAQQRIAELESSTVTVKLPDINEYLAEVHDKTLNRAFRLLAEGVRAGDVAAMRAAGIKVEAE